MRSGEMKEKEKKPVSSRGKVLARERVDRLVRRADDGEGYRHLGRRLAL